MYAVTFCSCVVGCSIILVYSSVGSLLQSPPLSSDFSYLRSLSETERERNDTKVVLLLQGVGMAYLRIAEQKM